MSVVLAPPPTEAPSRQEHAPNGKTPPVVEPDLDEPIEPERLTLLDRVGIVAGRKLRRLADRHLDGTLWPVGLVLLTLLVGAVPRLVDLHDLPPGLHQDEAIYAYEAYSIAMTGRDLLDHPFNLVAFATFGDWAPPMMNLLMAPLLAITAAIGVVTVWDAIRWAGRREHRRFTIDRKVGRSMQGVMLLGLLGAAIALPIELADRYDAYFDDYRTAGGQNFQEGAEPAIRYALAHAAEYDQIWVEDMTQSDAFLLFYGEWDPIDVHERLAVLRNPPWFNAVLTFDKYIFQKAPEGTVANLPVLTTFPIEGTLPPFEARGGITLEGQRTPVIRRSG